MTTARFLVEPPPVTPLPFGLLSAALVLDNLEGPAAALGVEYQPAACGAAYDAEGICEPDPDFGNLDAVVDDSSTLTLGVEGAPASTYTIQWGDGATTTTTTPDGETHTYGSDGTRVITVSDDHLGYVGTLQVTITDGTPVTVPVVGTIAYSRVPTEGLDLVEGDPFMLYHLFRCSPVGITEQDFTDRATQGLVLGEPRAVERVTAHQLALSEGAVDLTPGTGAVHPVRGLARLQGFAAANYGGVPVVHSPVEVTTLLGAMGAVHREGAHLETLQAVVASGGGYDGMAGPATDAGDPTSVQAPGDGEQWLYITGQVVVRRTPIISVGPVLDRDPTTGGRVNDLAALVERGYVVTTECVTAAIRVSTDVTAGAL